MNWNTETVLSFAFINVVLGVVWLVIDRKFGEWIFRFGYNVSHRDPLPPGEEIGFLFGRHGFENRFRRVCWLATIQFLVFWWYSHETFMTYFLFLVLSIPATYAGVYLLGQYLGSPFETAERYKRGEFSLAPYFNDMAAFVLKCLAAVSGYLPSISLGRAKAHEVRAEPVEVKPPEPTVDPYEVIDKYTRRK